MTGLHAEIEALLFGGPQRAAARGEWADPDKPIVFTMARLDRIKNISGLVEWYARCARLRELANLLIVGGTLDPERSKDREEQEQIRLIHELFHQHSLDGAARWVGFQSERNFVGELYRVVADRRGVFVQPALFEAYGLTVVEAMSCGLPVFATCYGGPSEIIEHGRSGFHIDPNHGAAAAESIADFLASCAAEGGRWADVSRASVERIQSRYTWSLYARRLMTLSRVYGFWKYVSNLEREETRRYLDSLYSLQYRPLAAAVPS
jgi:sucrose synthase